jgi:3-hydroxyisobutyrate dehydrogenase-like beta-hydroxyacid dehydrogenase
MSNAISTGGVIGLGMIGAGVATCLARSGQLAAVYDVRADATNGIPGCPALSSTPKALAQATDTVLIAVVSAKQTIDVLIGDDGVLAAARPGLNVVLLATVSLTDLAEIRALTDAAGVGLIDSGVTGGQKAKENGLVCLVGGTDEAIAKVKPVLDGFALSVAHMGPAGAGMAAKIARNVVVYGCLRAGYEAAALCRNAGVDVNQLTKVIEDSSQGVGGPMMLMSRADPLTDTQEAGVREYTRGLMIKDLEAARDLGKTFGIQLPLVELAISTDMAVVGLVDVMGEKA